MPHNKSTGMVLSPLVVAAVENAQLSNRFHQFRLKPCIATGRCESMTTLRDESGVDRRAGARLAARYFAVLKQSLEEDTERFIARVETHGRQTMGVSGLQAGHAASSHQAADG